MTMNEESEHVRVETAGTDSDSGADTERIIRGKVIELENPDVGWDTDIIPPPAKRFRVHRCGPKIDLKDMGDVELFQLTKTFVACSVGFIS